MADSDAPEPDNPSEAPEPADEQKSDPDQDESPFTEPEMQKFHGSEDYEPRPRSRGSDD